MNDTSGIGSRFRGAVLVCGMILLACAGCRPGRPLLVPVSGQVLLDGKPVGGASVVFVGEGRPATGVSDSSGRFSLGTWLVGDGAAAGDYIVCVTQESAPASPALADDAYAVPRNLLPPAYGAVGTTPLRARIDRGQENHFQLELNRSAEISKKLF